MKSSILIVDDVEVNRTLLAEVFSGDYDILEAEDGEQALEIVAENDNISAIMLDIIMPKMNGLQVLTELNRTGRIYRTPVFMITAADDTQTLTNAYRLGAVDIIQKPFRMCFIKARIENIIELYNHRNKLEEMTNEAYAKITQLNDSMVETLAALVEFRDIESGEHVHRIRALTELLMEEVSRDHNEYHIDRQALKKIGMAAVLHDVGKIAIPDNILKKPGKLTPEEFEIMKTHTTRGCEILEKMPEGIMDVEVYRYSYDICRYHHERWDGGGYPDKLSGDKIPIWAQVAGIADVFDALTSTRVYKPAFEIKTALQMINGGQCGTFNPKLLETFNKMIPEIIKKLDI